MSMPSFRPAIRAACACAGLSLVLLPGCMLLPDGTQQQRDLAAREGAPWQPAVGERELPELPAEPGWQDLVRRALLANGEVEAAWRDWSSAVARIDEASTWPDTNLHLGLSRMFSDEKLSGWDKTSVMLGFDPMRNLSWPSKVQAAGEAALDGARVAADRFAGVKFAVQRRVLEAWLDFSLLAERERLARRDATLAAALAATASGRLAAGGGGGQRAFVESRVQAALRQNDLAALASQLAGARARLNALVARPADAPLPAPASLPAPRPLPADDAALLARGAAGSPELAAMARESDAAEDMLEFARLQYLPDINPFAGFTGSVSQMVGAGIVLPTTLPAIDSRVVQAREGLEATRARLRQARLDRDGDFAARLVALRDAERQAAFFGGSVLPELVTAAANARQAYATGAATLPDLVAAESMLVEVERLVAEARIERERQLAALEELMGADGAALVAEAATAQAGRTGEVAAMDAAPSPAGKGGVR